MRKYESFIIVVPNINEEQQKEIENKYIEIINENGKLESSKNLGKKKLAYVVKGNTEGIYLDFIFESEFEFISELERLYRIDDNIIKFIVVKVED